MDNMAKMVFVSPSKNGWKAQSANTERAAGIFGTKAEATSKAIQMAKNQHAELVIQNKNGRIGEKNSYGNDPRNING